MVFIVLLTSFLVFGVHSEQQAELRSLFKYKGDVTNRETKTVPIDGTASFKPDGNSLMLSILISGLKSGPASPSSSSGGQSTSAPGQPSVAPTTVPQSPSNGNFKEYEKEALQKHNAFRSTHGSPAMTLNRKMCDDAQAYAEKIAKAGALVHASKEERNGNGENLSMGCSSKKAQTVSEAVTNWYNEVCNPGYAFNVESSQSGTGHFTQVVWSTSVELGIGYAFATRNGMLCSYTVGRYKPAGNMMSTYTEHVKKGSFDRSAYCSAISSQYDAEGLDSQSTSSSKTLKK